jgi:hypothetical protein
MAAQKARKPAADEARELPDIVRLGRRNSFEAKLPLSKIQAHVARRFGPAAEHAYTAESARDVAGQSWAVSREGEGSDVGCPF